jgi:hypothetical protein
VSPATNASAGDQSGCFSNNTRSFSSAASQSLTVRSSPEDKSNLPSEEKTRFRIAPSCANFDTSSGLDVSAAFSLISQMRMRLSAPPANNRLPSALNATL